MAEETFHFDNTAWERHKDNVIGNLTQLKDKVTAIPETSTVYLASMKNYYNGKLRQFVEDICAVEKAQYKETETFLRILGLDYFPTK